MSSAPRSTAQRLVALLRRVFPKHVWSVEGVDLLGGDPVVPEACTGVPPLYWCAIGQSAGRPLWVLGLDGVSTVLRKGSLAGGPTKRGVVYVASFPRAPRPDPKARTATVRH